MDDYTSHIDSNLDTISESFAQRMNLSLKSTNGQLGKDNSSRGTRMIATDLLYLHVPR